MNNAIHILFGRKIGQPNTPAKLYMRLRPGRRFTMPGSSGVIHGTILRWRGFNAEQHGDWYDVTYDIAPDLIHQVARELIKRRAFGSTRSVGGT